MCLLKDWSGLGQDWSLNLKELVEGLQLWLRTIAAGMQVHLEFWKERLGTSRCCGSTHPLTGLSHLLAVIMCVVNQGLDVVDSRVEEW